MTSTRIKGKVTPEALFARVEAAWDKARKDRPMPRRQDIDAIQLGNYLPYVGLIDVVHGAQLDLRFRLVGAKTTQSFGFDLTGQMHSVLSRGRSQDSRFYQACQRCVETREPQMFKIENARNSQDLPFQVTARIWPLSDDGENVTCILGGAVFNNTALAAN